MIVDCSSCTQRFMIANGITRIIETLSQFGSNGDVDDFTGGGAISIDVYSTIFVAEII